MTGSNTDGAQPLLRNRYRLAELIGHGGLASVYRARDEFLGRDVAVKMFHASHSAERDYRLQEDEVNTLAMLNHPDLVTLLDVGVHRERDETRIFSVLELVEGTDLRQRLLEGPISPRQIAQLGYHVASGLEHVHALGIVHRDVKPANILLQQLSDGARVSGKLGDFGLASRGVGPAIAAGQAITGTVAYLSPEQARGDLVTTASDVYSLGLVLLECFTRRLAFPGEPQESLSARLVSAPPMDDDVPAEWIPLLRAMTAPDPADRPPIGEVTRALRDAFAAETGRHRAVTKEDVARLAEILSQDPESLATEPPGP
jgi:serine/threonine protein kinase